MQCVVAFGYTGNRNDDSPQRVQGVRKLFSILESGECTIQFDQFRQRDPSFICLIRYKWENFSSRDRIPDFSDSLGREPPPRGSGARL